MKLAIALVAITTLTACGSASTLGQVTPGLTSNSSIGVGYDELEARNAALNAAYDHCRGYNVLNMETNYKGTMPESDRDPGGSGWLSGQNDDYEVTIIFSCDEDKVGS